MSIRVLICDDQALVRAGFRAILEAQPDVEVVGEAENGAEAVALAERRAPDVILMDIRMPVLDGVEATRRLVADGSPARILVLTTFDLDEYVHAAIRAGASGFLLKDVTPAKLLEAIRVVAAGDALLAPSVTRRLLERFATTLPQRDHSTRGAGRAHRARDRGAAAAGRRPVQRGDRRLAGGQRGDGQDAHLEPAAQAGPARPRAGRDSRLRDRSGHARRQIPRAQPSLRASEPPNRRAVAEDDGLTAAERDALGGATDFQTELGATRRRGPRAAAQVHRGAVDPEASAVERGLRIARTVVPRPSARTGTGRGTGPG